VAWLLRSLDEAGKSSLDQAQVQALYPKDELLKRSNKQSFTFYFIPESSLNLAHVGHIVAHTEAEKQRPYGSHPWTVVMDLFQDA
jgi:hypothetical protein